MLDEEITISTSTAMEINDGSSDATTSNVTNTPTITFGYSRGKKRKIQKQNCSLNLTIILVKLFLIIQYNYTGKIAQQNNIFCYKYDIKIKYYLNSISSIKRIYRSDAPLNGLVNDDKTINFLVKLLVKIYLNQYKFIQNRESITFSTQCTENLSNNPLGSNHQNNENMTSGSNCNTIENIAEYFYMFVQESSDIHKQSLSTKKEINTLIEKTTSSNIIDNFIFILNTLNHIHPNNELEQFVKVLSDQISKGLDKEKQNSTVTKSDKVIEFDNEFDIQIQKLIGFSKDIPDDNLFGNLISLQNLEFIEYIFPTGLLLTDPENVLHIKLYSLFNSIQKQRFNNEKPTTFLKVLTEIISFIEFIIKQKGAMPNEAEACKEMNLCFDQYKASLESICYGRNDSYDKISAVTAIKILTYSVEIQCNLICKFLQHNIMKNLYFAMPHLVYLNANAFVRLKAYAIFMRNVFLTNTTFFSAFTNFVQSIQQSNQEPLFSFAKLKDKFILDMNQNLIFNEIRAIEQI